VKRKYGFLGMIAVLLQVFGVLAIIGAVISLAVAAYNTYLAQPPQESSFLIAQAVNIFVLGIGIYAFGGLINVFREIELNTRRTAYYLLQLNRVNAQRRAARQANAQQRQPRQRPVTTETLPRG
jgi:uncharacterized membrane protein